MPDSPSPTADTDHTGATPDWLELRAARSYPNWKEDVGRPEDEIDHRPAGGPRLSYLWCEDSLTGQTLYLGGNVGVDGKLYFIPGHAKRVMVCDPTTDRVTLTGPIFPGKFKWLRGVNVDGGKIYGLPCHADTVLCIDVPSGKITTIPIPYDDVFSDPVQAKEERQCKWKYHGGTICPIDKAIYCIPQSALHVLKIDPVSGTCQLVGPELPGKYKWYGGVVGKHDQAIYAIPHNSPHVLRISPSAITLHGDYGSGGHKWHGASPAPNGDIVSVPANADSVLVIRPGLEPEMFEIGDTLCVKSGRHRTDRKYKFLGAMTGSDGLVYCFPSGSERVLQVDTETLHVREVGPNLFDMERICQNKWQNGLTLFENVYAIPLAGESLLRIDCSQDPPLVTTWLLPSPHRVLDKWEGGIIAPNGVIYTVPNNHKAILRIEAPRSEVSKDAGYPAVSQTSGEVDIPYLSGIPTLRSSAHRVKHAPRSRKHDPSPTHGDEKQPGTVFLPRSLLKEEVFAYDSNVYNMHEAVVKLLQQCDADIVGSFRCESEHKLEDFCVPTDSTWRSVNGGKCEDAQKYLSDQIARNAAFLADFDRLVLEVVLPYMKKRLVAAGVADSHVPVKFFYQTAVLAKEVELLQKAFQSQASILQHVEVARFKSQLKMGALQAAKHGDPEDARTSRPFPRSQSSPSSVALATLRRLPQAEQRRRLLELLQSDLGREEDVEDESWRMPELNVEARTASADGMRFETRMCWIQQLGDEELERMLKTCRLVFALDGSSWMPFHETPRCFAERLALAVFRHHTAGCRFDPARSGAEWWAQVRQSGHHEEGIQFHWDTDEVAVERHDVNVHPHLSTVTYLSESGAPTLVLACRNSRRPSLTSAYGPIHEGALSWPKLWKHLVFDGQFLHGTVPSLEYGKDGPRVTFLVNIWLNHRPSNCHRLPKSLSKRLGDAPMPPNILTETIRPPLYAGQHSDTTKFETAFGRRQRLDDELHKQEARNSETERCAHETAAMRIEELMTKQADLILERQRLLGALEESRRAVQKSLGVPNPAAAVDSARVAGLEQQLTLERKRLVEQAVALQQAGRRVAQLESTQQPGDDARQRAGQIQRDLTQELQSSNARRVEAELRLHQAEESAAMAGEDLCATKIDMIRLRAALDEHRRLQQSCPQLAPSGLACILECLLDGNYSKRRVPTCEYSCLASRSQFFNLSRGNGYRT
ncbi:unnamed protein product [Symbiodinium sp. CCMP2456]|nr:unnamed protein product [Symbiodinium sp. CCMP2456]